MTNMKSFLEFRKNGFNYLTFNNNDVVFEKFITYQSIVSINQVCVINNVYDWYSFPDTGINRNVYSSCENNKQYNYQFIKLPIFYINLNNKNSVGIYDESLIKCYPKYSGKIMTFNDVKQNWTTIFGYLFTDHHYINTDYDIWLKDNNDMLINMNKLNNMRNKLIDNFNNWSNCCKMTEDK